MYPDLLEIFGVTLHGATFELVLWSLVCLLMLWGLVSSVLDFRKGRKGEGLVQGVVVLGILIAAGVKLYQSTQPGYELVFSEPLVIHTYAFCILVGVVIGILSSMKMSKMRGDDPMDIVRLAAALLVFGFLGARAAHVIVEYETYWNSCFHPELAGLKESSCLRVLNFAEGGLTFYGGVIAGMVVMTVFFFSRKRGGKPLEILHVLDLLAAGLAVIHGFGRLGCLAAGCCWGAITRGHLGVHYGEHSFAYDELIKDPQLHDMMVKTGETPLLHATQIYESIGEFVLFGLLWLMFCKKARPGRMVAFWFMGYGILRFVVEFMRADSDRGYYFKKSIEGINDLIMVPADHATILSTSQGIALIMVALGAGVMISTVISARRGQEA